MMPLSQHASLDTVTSDGYCFREKMRQTSSEATEAIARLAESTIGPITPTVSLNVRTELHNVIRENVQANGGAGGRGGGGGGAMK